MEDVSLIKKIIEDKRIELNRVVIKNELTSKEVLEKSIELDILVNQYYTLKRAAE